MREVLAPLRRRRDADCVTGKEVIEERVGVTARIESGVGSRLTLLEPDCAGLASRFRSWGDT
jgi:hypothetical protein